MKRPFSAAIVILTLSIFVKPTHGVGFQAGPITLAELQLAGDTLPRDRAVFERAYHSPNASVVMRATAVRLIGRMESAFPDMPAADAWVGSHDADVSVRREAANAIGQGHAGDAALPSDVSAKVNARDHAFITSWLAGEREDSVSDILLRSLGRLHLDAAGTREIEHELVSNTKGSSVRILGALTGLVTLTVPRDVKARLDPATRVRVRELAIANRPGGYAEFRVRRVAINLLQTLNDTDAPTIAAARDDPDWQVRRFAVMMTSATDALLTGALDKQFVIYTDFHVRWEALRILARGMTGTTPCTALIRAIDDPEPVVQIQALSLLKPTCPERDAIIAKITPIASRLRTALDTWQVPAAALTALAKLSKPDALRLNLAAVAHKTWEVRAAAAGVAADVGDDATMVSLAHDTVPNVRNAALEALVQTKSPSLAKACIDSLESTDHQLVRTAARSLAGATMKDEATRALMASLERLTKIGADNSRDARTAILDRLRELMPADQAAALRPYLIDYDPAVATLASAVMKAKGVADAAATPHLRPLEQPTLAELRALPSHATISMADGSVIEFELFPMEAPVTVWRFASLATKGYYNGLTFHRIVPNFVVQGGSPGASEYVGDSRFMRDEEGLSEHVRGAVGVSTRGRDTGDAQLFIDLVDYPRLNHDYTVFARVISGMELVDRMLEGALIRAITVK